MKFAARFCRIQATDEGNNEGGNLDRGLAKQTKCKVVKNVLMDHVYNPYATTWKWKICQGNLRKDWAIVLK